jgi:hypothetical protein
MNSRIRVFFYASMISLLALISAFSVIPARADDGAPPPPPPSSSSSTTTDIPAVLSQVPAGTELVVVDRSRHKVPLAYQEAAHIVAAGDPIWCPAGAPPIPGAGTCTLTYPNLYSLINAFITNAIPDPAANGVIWIFGYSTNSNVPDSSVSAIQINGTNVNLGTWANFSLALKGGWTGTAAGTINTSDPSRFNVPISIVNWNADVTLSDITITGVVGAGTTALTVTTAKKITLTDLDVISNAGHGATLNNMTGSSDVVVTSAQFTGNTAGSGLEVYSNGAVSLNSITAISNGGSGVLVDNSGATGNKPVTLTGSNEFKFNLWGLVIYSNGAVTLHNITSIGNSSGSGLTVINPYLGPTLPQNVTLTGFGIFNQNSDAGLDIETYGAITLTAVTADGNGSYGAYLNNYGTGSINYPYATLPRAVTITGAPDAEFMNNNIGLFINSFGAITLIGVEADGNTTYGALVENDFAGAVGGVTFGGWGADFSNNGDYGLHAVTKGAITGGGTFGLSAWSNGSDGVRLDNYNALSPKAVTINGSYGMFGNNGGSGLTVYSLGAITLKNVTADGNAGLGAYLFNQYPAALGAITLSGGNAFHDNSVNGLEVYSKGAITLSNVEAANNKIGVYLNNNYSGAVGAITLTGGGNFHDNSSYGLNVAGTGAITVNNLNVANNQVGANLANNFTGVTGAITINGSNGFHDNSDTALYVYANGNILLNNVDVRNNGFGAFLENDYPFVTGNVTITGYGSFHENFRDGLIITSHGAVTLNNTYAANNGNVALNGYGVLVDNSLAATPKAVTLKGSNGLYNNYFGNLYIKSRGAITLSNLDANDSLNGTGVYLENTPSLSGSPQSVTIAGHGNFYNNALSGLMVYSYGAITLSNINAGDNHTGSGIYLDNSGGTIAKPVTINGFINVNNNTGGYGLHINSLGAVKLANLNADNNSYGAFIDNRGGSPMPVTIMGGANTTNNSSYGMRVLSIGAITFTLTDAYIGWNGTYGWTLDNSFNGSIGGITLSTGTFNNLDFDSNGTYGLGAFSLGSIKVTNLDAWNNGDDGAYLQNAFTGSTGTVTLLTTNSNNNFNNNAGYGLVVVSNRAVTITGLHADSNGIGGAWLDNTPSTGGSPQNVTLLGHSYLTNNGDDGLFITSFGIVTLNGLDANGNGTNHASLGWGAHLDNCGYSGSACTGVTPKAITLNGINTFFGNYQDGLWIASMGAIKVNQVGSGSNTQGGAYLNNQWTGAVGGITLTTAVPTNINYFTDNGYVGLVAMSNGALALSSIWANRNLEGGAFLDNCKDTSSGCMVASANVTLTGRNRFENNGDGIHPYSGLVVYSDGSISINNILSTGNAGNGASLDNCTDHSGCTSAGNITLTGANDFSNNTYSGLVFYSGGTVSMTRITSDQNSIGPGIDGSAQGPITITCGSFNNNNTYGLRLSSPAAITLIHVVATGNGSTDIATFGGGSVTYVRNCPLLP